LREAGGSALPTGSPVRSRPKQPRRSITGEEELRGGTRSPPRWPLSPFSTMDLDVAAEQKARPVQVSRRPDTERIGRPWLAAVVQLDGEGLCSRAGGPNHRRRASERG